MLVAPTEPVVIRRLGRTSSMPEKFGVDVFFVANKQRCGVQRKEVRDFVASVVDGRLHREVQQMVRLDVAVLCVEGMFAWTTDGMWAGPGKWDRFRHRQWLFDLMLRGIWVVESRDTGDTAEVCRELERWAKKDHHRGPDRRPTVNGVWGRATSREFACHLLQGIDGIGPELAEAIVEKFGRAPIGWTVPAGDLLGVPGIGPKRVKRMMEALG